jgi:hypothetical protein
MATIAFTIDRFRTDFPEFTSETKYTDEMITFWYEMASSMLSSTRWGFRLYYGICFFVAHNITLQAMDVEDAVSGDPGRNTQIVNSEGVGGVSVSVDNSASIENDGGSYNETRYGKQFLRLSRQVGIGGMFV